MTMVRIWNITDGGRPGMTSHNRMVLGQALKPGRSLQVDEARLMYASKVHTDVKAKMLHIGPRPPTWYLNLKKPLRAVVDARKVTDKGQYVGKKVVVARAHGALPTKAIAADSAEAIDKAAPEEAKIKEASVDAAEEAPTEASTEEESSSGSSRRSRRGRR